MPASQTAAPVRPDGGATLVSVVIPAYNAQAFLAQAIQSVLAQRYPSLELIVVDDGSSDDTAAIIAGFGKRLRSLFQPNAGLAAARNAGAALARGDYLAFLDADDLFLPNKLTLQAAALDRDPGLALVASGLRLVDSGGRLLQVVRPWAHQPRIDGERLTYLGLVGVHGVLLRRSWFERVGGFDVRLPFCEDMDFWWRLWAAGGHMAWLPALVGDYRIHGTNMSQRVLEHHRWRVALLRRQLASGLLDPTVTARRDTVIARLKLSAAGRLYGLSDPASAASLLDEALDLDPGLLTATRAELLDALAAWRDDVWIEDRADIHARALARLPRRLDWLASRPELLDIACWRRRFYNAVAERDGPTLRRAWLHLVCRDLHWLANRGSWSLLVRSLGYGRERTAPTPSAAEVQGGLPS